ncbi:MAG: 50S ribosomal protein P1 [Candidatus Bathyarchaeia archaeon]|nr:50S ribosomal protein P1 [Candidatus Bathyarchaeota archaeon]
MEYVYAAMLLHRAGKEINEENLTRVLSAAGVNVDAVRVKALVAALSEINIDEVIKSASTMMAAPVAAAPTPTTGAEAKPKEEEKKKKEEEEKAREEAALEGLGALFG